MLEMSDVARFVARLRLAAVVGALAAPASAQVAGPEVQVALRDQGWAQVMVALRPVDVPSADLDRLAVAVAEQRARVLLGLEEEDFVLTHEYTTLSAMAGRLDANGLVKLLRDPEVLRIDVDVPGRMSAGESVPMIRADEAHGRGARGGGVVVAVLDTGVDTDHPDLADSIVDQQCFCTNANGSGCCPGGGTTASGPGAAEDDQGHGTNVAGIITGNGSSAPPGVAPDSQLVAIKVLDANGAASGTAQVLAALDYILASRPDVRVVNLSLVFSSFPGTCDNAASFTIPFAQAINSLKARGTAVVASSGNNALTNQIGAPACIASTVAVGAVYDGNVGSVSFGCVDGSTGADLVTCFSNSSTAVDLLAPGAAITSSGLGGGAATFLGTSQAAPHVAGAIAVLMSAGQSADGAEAALKNTGIAVSDPKSGLTFPRIDVGAASQ